MCNVLSKRENKEAAKTNEFSSVGSHTLVNVNVKVSRCGGKGQAVVVHSPRGTLILESTSEESSLSGGPTLSTLAVRVQWPVSYITAI